MRISDWSSDVCSSDLRLLRHLAELRARRGQPQAMRAAVEQRRADPAFERAHAAAEGGLGHVPPLRGSQEVHALDQRLEVLQPAEQIGRASCRERVCPYV